MLLITAASADDELAAMLAVARDLGMGALVETHADDELERALASGAEVIGVNARDLETLEVDVAARSRRACAVSRAIGSRSSSRASDARRRATRRCERAHLPSWSARP